jgi:hypothetical protein
MAWRGRSHPATSVWLQWSHQELSPDQPVCRTGVLPLDDEPSVVLFTVQSLTIPHFPLVLRFESAFRVAQPPMGGTHRAADTPAAFPSRFSSSSHSGPDGSRTHHTDLARVSRLQRHAGPLRGPRWESNPVPLLTTEVCCRNTYRPGENDECRMMNDELISAGAFLNQHSEFLVHPSELQAPVSNRAHRPYDDQLGTCRACIK